VHKAVRAIVCEDRKFGVCWELGAIQVEERPVAGDEVVLDCDRVWILQIKQAGEDA
jgi:hypothetical protein